jgi:hypothetical protein
VFGNAELERRDPGLEHTIGGDREAIHRQAAERLLNVREGHAGVDERAQNHVAGGAGKAVEVERLHVSRFPALKLK